MLIRLITIILFLSNLAFSNEIDTQFQKGNELYQKGDYEQAIKIYDTIVEKGYQETSLYYNLGNAYFRSGKIGLAILYYEKAKKLAPSDEDINHNLSFANTKIVDKIETLPRFFIFDWWENLLAFISVSGWTYLTYAFYLIILGSFAYYFFAKSLKVQRISVYTGIIAVFFFVFSIILLLVNLNREFNVRYGIILEPAAVVKFSPDTNSKDAFVVHEGLKVRAEDKIDNWIKIKLIDGKVGWLSEKNLKII